jgi:lipopolysaccharide export LptBFGC system permease protein LptF
MMFPLLIIGLFGVSAIVMLLWNWLIPSISQFSPLTYWQAMGLFVLSRILFGGFSFRHHHNAARRHFDAMPFKAKFMNMSDDERQQFKSQWKQRCCKTPN